MSMVTPTRRYLGEAAEIVAACDADEIEAVVKALALTRERGGIVWTLGLGGSAATASHMSNDLRKLCEIDSRCLSDNAPEMLARINDDGWHVWAEGALAFAINRDALLVCSVGGGSGGLSAPIVAAAVKARGRGMPVIAIVGRNGGDLMGVAHHTVLIPPLHSDRVTPHTEGIASVVCHAIVSHPDLQRRKTMW